MKVLLRNSATGMYFRDIEKWTRDPWQATPFQRSGSALQFIAEHQLQDVEMVLSFQDPRYNLHLPPLGQPVARLLASGAADHL